MEAKITEKRWSKEFEDPITKRWQENVEYPFEDNDKPIYSIDTPPPYVNSPIHIGHATTYVLMDMFARFKRMTGHNVLFPLGLDRNGLPIEMAAEKRFNVKLTETKRDEFLKLCKQVLEETSAASKDSFAKLGISFNSWKEGSRPGDVYLTDSVDFRTLTQDTFIDLWNRGLIKEEARINNFCVSCQTTLADAEIEYKKQESFFNDIVFKVKETGEEIVIGTTRPELIGACGMVIFNPEDERYSHLKNKTAVTPIYEKEVKIMAHPLAQQDKGTGLMMMCSAGDVSDIQFFREQSLQPTILIEKDGKMNEHAGPLHGLYVKKARGKIIEILKESGLIKSQARIEHNVPACERCKSNIEFIQMEEYYVSQLHVKDKIKTLSKELNFYSKKARYLLENWIDSVSIDWPISRRRYYATEIPLWYCKECNEIIVPPKGSYYQPWKEDPPIQKCPKCGCTEFRGEERVLDTWFDSSNTPLYILKKDTELFSRAFPCTLRPQGKEIVRTWLYYTLLKNYLLNENLIFKDAWIHHHVIDEKGYKMSKSKGNGIDPHEVLEKYGAEPLRLWVATEGNITNGDLRCSFQRIESNTKTLTKLWNVCRFISMFDNPNSEITQELDKWIVCELDELIEFTQAKYNEYDFYTPALKIRHFLWETFSSHYMELVKKRAYNEENSFTKEEQDSALSTLHYCVDTILKLWAPVIPIVTEKLFEELREKKIHKEEFPMIKKLKRESGFTTQNICGLNSMVWKTKKDAGLSLKQPIEHIMLKSIFKGIEKDIKAAHSTEKIEFGETGEIHLISTKEK